MNETDEKRALAVKELRVIIKETADAGDDLAKGVLETFGEKPDGMLVRFIRARKYDVPRAFDLMKGGSPPTTVLYVVQLSGKVFCLFH